MRPGERDLLLLSRPDQTSGLFLQSISVSPDGELVSATLPFRATITGFFAGSPDETL